MIIKTWKIKEYGWDAYYREVVAITHGRSDVEIECLKPGVLSVKQIRKVTTKVSNHLTRRQDD